MDGSIDAVLAGRDPDTCDEVARNVLALDWQNNRAAYVKAIVDGHLNWSAASSRFASA